MTVFVENETEAKFPFEPLEVATRVAEAVLEEEGCPYETEINVLLTDNEGIRIYNKVGLTAKRMSCRFLMCRLSPLRISMWQKRWKRTVFSRTAAN